MVVEILSAEKKGEKSVQPAGKVLPYDRFETDKWDVMDADVRLSLLRAKRFANSHMTQRNACLIH